MTSKRKNPPLLLGARLQQVLRAAEEEVINAESNAWRCRNLPDPYPSAKYAADVNRVIKLLVEAINLERGYTK